MNRVSARRALCAALVAVLPSIASGQPAKATAVLRADQPGPVVNRNIYGHFAEHLGRCIYDGIWVGEDSPIPNTRGIRNDIIEALQATATSPTCAGPAAASPTTTTGATASARATSARKRVNMHWGQVVEDNAFGTHEFLDLCELIGAEPYIAGNVGSGTPQEMRDWIEYMTFDGDSELANLRRAERPREAVEDSVLRRRQRELGLRRQHAARVLRRPVPPLRHLRAATSAATGLTRVACGPSGVDHNWTDVLMDRAGDAHAGLSLHFYTLPTGNWENKTPATGFGEDEWFAMLARMPAHRAGDPRSTRTIMDRVDPQKRIALFVDEWGTWYDVEPGTNPGFLYQQNTLRDAVLAGAHVPHLPRAQRPRARWPTSPRRSTCCRR